MTREIRLNDRVRHTTIKLGDKRCSERKATTPKKVFSVTDVINVVGNGIRTLWNGYMLLLQTEKRLGETISEASEKMAEKIAREGLFGEDRYNGKGRRTDYVIAETYDDICYINREMMNLSEKEREQYIKAAAQRRANGTAVPGRETGILRTFNGF